MKKILPVILFLCLLSSAAFAQNTADVTVEVTDTEVIATFTGFMPLYGGACCSYFIYCQNRVVLFGGQTVERAQY